MINTLILAAVLAATPPAAPGTPFGMGVAAYENGDFAAAAEAWETWTRQQGIDAATCFNLGNAYYKSGKLGRAVLAWERARRIDPGDKETAENLEFARRLLVDEVPVEESVLARLLARAAAAVSFAESMLVALLLWEILGAAALVAILAGDSKRRAAVALAGVTLVVLLVIMPVVVWQWQSRVDRSQAVVLAKVIEVRSGPGDRYTSVFTVHEGLVVRVKQTASGWHQVALPNGLAGWVPADAVERI